MDTLKDLVVRDIRAQSEAELGRLSRQFARAASEEKEAILAEMEFEKFMIETADVCLDKRPANQ